MSIRFFLPVSLSLVALTACEDVITVPEEPEPEQITPRDGAWKLELGRADVSGRCEIDEDELEGQELSAMLVNDAERGVLIAIEGVALRGHVEDSEVVAEGRVFEDRGTPDHDHDVDPPKKHQDGDDADDGDDGDAEEGGAAPPCEVEEAESDAPESDVDAAEAFGTWITLSGELSDRKHMDGVIVVRASTPDQSCEIEVDFDGRWVGDDVVVTEAPNRKETECDEDEGDCG